MNFSLPQSLELLKRTPQAYRALFYGLKFPWGEINEGDQTWSAYNILGHLIHGEKTDWIPRARIILSDSVSDKTFEPFDRFAQERLYHGKTIEELIEEFEELRERNLDELKSWDLREEQLELRGVHPDLGEVSLRQLLATWTIHDMSHLHQVSRVIVKHYTQDVGPWKAYSRIMKEAEA